MGGIRLGKLGALIDTKRCPHALALSADPGSKCVERLGPQAANNLFGSA